MTVVLTLVGVLLLPAVTTGEKPPPASEEATRVSLIQLIANPEKYEGVWVQVIGVGRFQFEESAVYLHREDADLLNSSNGVWVDGGAKTAGLTGAAVLVQGRFTAKQHGHLGAWPGTITEVRRLEKVRTREEYEQRIRRTPPPPTRPQ
jgi:hypothetical protein